MIKALLLLGLCWGVPQDEEDVEKPSSSEPASLRPVFLGLLLGLPCLSVLLLTISGVQLRGFAKRLPKIGSRGDLEEFKAFVKTQMFLALIALPGLFLNGLVWPVGWFMGELSFGDLVYAIVPSLVVFGVAKVIKGTEEHVQTLPIADELRRERDTIVDKWKSSPIPDW